MGVSVGHGPAGWAPNELVGKSDVDLIHPDERPAIARAKKDAPLEGATRTRFRMRSRAGPYRWVASTYNPIRASGDVIGYVEAITDAAEEVVTENKLSASERHYRLLAESAADSLRHLYSVEPGKDSMDVRMRRRNRGGDYRWMLGTGTRVHDASGRVEYVVAGLRGITDEVAAHD